MRHELIQQQRDLDAVDIAAVWPSIAQLAPLPVPDLVRNDEPVRGAPAEAVPDMPAAAGIFIVVAYCALLATLAFGMTGSGESLFVIAVDVVFLCMFFAVPAAFLGLANAGQGHPSLSRFMQDGIQTFTGHSTGGAALVQMLIVPVALTFGVICMSIAAAIIF